MSYIQLSDLVEAFGEDEMVQITRSADLESIDTLKVAKAIGYAASRIDPAVRAAGLTPPVADPLLAEIACDLARWRLYEDAPTDSVTTRFETAIADLNRIAMRKLQLSVDPGENHNAGMPQFSTPGRVFDDDGLEGF